MILDKVQFKAVENMKNGCVLCGGVGSGKSRAALAYFYSKVCPGNLNTMEPLRAHKPVYIITTAKKRDDGDWIEEAEPFHLKNITVDSWNNIKKYDKVYGAFFIFDEQRVVGSGQWVKAFLNIARKNQWILLSATPGDTWMDYIPLFVANGFYKNRTDFINQHVVYARNTKFPCVQKYIGTGILQKHRVDILVPMEVERHTKRNRLSVLCEYDKTTYDIVNKKRWNPIEEKPIENVSELCYILRRIVNCDPSRLEETMKIIKREKKVIIFYNFDYELEILHSALQHAHIMYSEWNGHKHEPILEDLDMWAYLVQYNAGAEGWNCITTNVLIFYSANYSYKINEQVEGRIDRRNTPYTDLYYYRLKSQAPIDKAIMTAIKEKKNFNEKAFVKKL